MGTKGVNDKAFALYEELKLRVSNDSNRVAIYKRRHAEKNKPILMSTGMGDLEEITDAVKTAKEAGCRERLLFHCISSYPTPLKDINIKMILELKERFKVQVGLSDHTLNNTSPTMYLQLSRVSEKI